MDPEIPYLSFDFEGLHYFWQWFVSELQLALKKTMELFFTWILGSIVALELLCEVVPLITLVLVLMAFCLYFK